MVALERLIQLRDLRYIGLAVVVALDIPLVVMEALAVAVEELDPSADLTVQVAALH